MADYLDPGASPADRSPLERRRSKNPLRNMMQHLTVESAASGDGTTSRRQSLIRRLSGQKSRSPSAHSEANPASRASSRPASALGINRDPALCEVCSSLAAEIEDSLDEVDFTFTRAVNPGTADDFEKREYFLAKLKGLEENRWAATCPMCKLFWAVHVPCTEPGEYSLLGMSSRDTSYLVDSHKMYDLEHAARAKTKGVGPGFLTVISKSQIPGARNPDVSPDWFRESGMLFRTRPEFYFDDVRGRTGAGGRLAAPEPTSPCPSPSRRGSDDGSWAQKGIWGREIGRTIDFSVAREWLHFCETRHKGRCGRRPVLAELQGFRLIDCAHSPPQVVQRSLTEDYVALSYVRGKPTNETNWPRVVRDAVAVTKDLGFRYLWVDAVCIDNSRQEERVGHIERMNDIFEGAVVTIIAACGDDAMHGLPGVGSTARPAQPKYRFTTSNIALVSSLQDPRLLVKSSTWYTRGWTYQEGLCARRRLIFTDEQMYWECEGMACPETIDLPLDFYHDSEEQRMCDFVRPGLFNGVSYFDGSWEQWKKLPQKAGEPSTLSIFREADQHIVNYTRRNLTYDEDSLNAFLGISQRLESTLGQGKLSSLVGVPIWVPASGGSSSGGVPGRARTRHLFALSTCFWHHKDGVRARRRHHLPSWTWAGWAGAVDLFSSVIIATDPDCKVKGRKVLNHHYVTATQLTRNEPSSVKWTYSPEMLVLGPDGSVVYDFGDGSASLHPAAGPPSFSPGRYALRVSDPMVLDRVKARTHPGGWMFNELSVDVKMSGGSGGTDTFGPDGQPAMSSIRDYIQRHGRGEQMTVLWFVEEAMVLLLVVGKTSRGTWERIGRMRMAFPEEGKDVVKSCGRLDSLLNRLPLRRLGEDIIIE
ncbi:hypothetical protein PT974_09700 [Cladobotryum mycophilum]|uniref:Heterokaryon incompatibility domain-containing protein n=1 Tax=Cladobotryum mycophilum TaxID=491253 RepID=A0ABR0SGY7_9HYPO